ncbi:MAG: hypothetical protein WAZ15_04380 [Propioniciclava sp.]
MTDTPISDASEPVDHAAALAAHARALYKSSHLLRDHPEQVYRVLEAIEDAVQYLDDVVKETSESYKKHAATAVTMLGDQAKGTQSAVFAAGYLRAAVHNVRSLRDLLMHATAESDRLYWPQHDPVAAEQLRELRELLDQRAGNVAPEQPTASTASRPPRDPLQP